jgi:hypothetical protein
MVDDDSARLEKLQKQLAQLKQWNDTQAHELMTKDKLIKEKDSTINELEAKMDELKKKVDSSGTVLAQQVTGIKKTETDLIKHTQNHLTKIFESIQSIQRELLEQIGEREYHLLDTIQELHNKEIETFQAQVTLLNQKIKLLQIADLDLTLPEIALPASVSPPEPQSTPDEKPTLETPASPADLPTFAKIEKDEPVGKPAVKAVERPIYLAFENNVFLRVKRPPDSGISLILDPKELKWILVWTSEIGFVKRRTAERQARSIAKAGYTTEKGDRLGQAYPLELIGEKSVPSRLLRDQHQY